MLIQLLLPPYAASLPSLNMVKTVLDCLSTPEKFPLPMDDRLRNAMTLALLSKIPPTDKTNDAALNTAIAAVANLNEQALIAVCDLLDEYARQRSTVTTEGISHLKASAEVPAQLLNAIVPVLEKAPLPLAQQALLALAQYCTGFRYSGYAEIHPPLTSLFKTRPELASLEIRALFALTVGGQHNGYLPQTLHWDSPEKIEVARACLKQYIRYAMSTQAQLQKSLGRKLNVPVKNHLGEQLARPTVLQNLNTILGLSAEQAKELLHDHLHLLEIEIANLSLYYRIVPLVGRGEQFTYLRPCLYDEPTHHGKNKDYLETVAERLGHLTRLALEVEPALLPRLGELIAQWPAKADSQVVLQWFQQLTGLEIKLHSAQVAQA